MKTKIQKFRKIDKTELLNSILVIKGLILSDMQYVDHDLSGDKDTLNIAKKIMIETHKDEGNSDDVLYEIYSTEIKEIYKKLVKGGKNLMNNFKLFVNYLEQSEKEIDNKYVSIPDGFEEIEVSEESEDGLPF